MDLSVLKQLNKKAADSFHQQKHLIKKVLLGKVSTCSHCHQPLKVTLPEKNSMGRIVCANKCTDIMFEQ